MSLPGFARSAIVLGVGYAVAAALIWMLVNVPESNVLALTLSAGLVAAVAVTAGITTASATMFTRETSVSVVMRRAVAAVPGFLIGLFVFGCIWWLTGWADLWWALRRGEIDAVFLRYVGWSGTQPIHAAMAWATWLIRWVLGLSILMALAAAGARGGVRNLGVGFRLSVQWLPLIALTFGLLLVSQGLWRLVYWRPGMLPATSAEVAFAGFKLVVLYALAIGVAALVARVYGRAAARI